MKRMHVSISVKDLDQSVKFYSTIFGTEPTLVRDDYARWMLDDPLLNFSVQARDREIGIDHVGIQSETEDEMKDVFDRMKQSERPIIEMGEVSCCYSRQEKSWVADPQGLFWEAFVTKGDQTLYGEDPRTYDELRNKIAQDDAAAEAKGAESACCA